MNPPETPCDDRDPRVTFAAERTLLAWIRTALALMGFGFVVARFGLVLPEMAGHHDAQVQRQVGGSQWVGAGLILLGVAMNVLAAVQHARFVRRINQGQPVTAAKPVSMGVVLSCLLGLSGLGLAVYLLRVP